MAFQVTPEQRDAFLGSHEMFTRVQVFRGDEYLGEIPATEVAVAATYGTQGGRDAAFTVDTDVTDRGLLNPLSDQVMISTGIPGVVEVPLFTGRVDEPETYDDGRVRVSLISRGVEARRAPFLVPWAAHLNNQAWNEIRLILQDVDPSWSVYYTGDRISTIPPNLLWEEDRTQACDQLAQGANLIWQPDRTGGFVVFDNPYSVGPEASENSVVTLVDGEDGTLVQVEGTSSREGMFNSVTVITERTNNTLPIRVTAMDTSPTSPTQWGGLFGKQNLIIKNQTPLDVAGSQLLALRVLRQTLARQRSFTITCTNMPLLDPGDIFILFYQNLVYALVVERITYSCSGDEPTIISARELLFREDIGIV